MNIEPAPTPSPTPGVETPPVETPPTPSPTPTPEPTPSPTPAPTLAGTPPAGEPAPFVPLTAEDFKLPEIEGLQVSNELRDEFLGVMNNQELSPKDRAQALVDLQGKVATLASEAASKEFDDLNTKWQDEVKADPEIGGTKLPETLGRITRLINEHGGDKVRTALNITGAGNNPDLIRFFNSVALKLTEPGPVSGQPAASEASTASKLFPSMKG